MAHKCKLCDFEPSVDQWDLPIHYAKVHFNEEFQKVISWNAATESLQCLYDNCDFQSFSMKCMQLHVGLSHGLLVPLCDQTSLQLNTTKCPGCKLHFMLADNAIDHFKSVHSNESTKLKCDTCNKAFNNMIDYLNPR